MVQVRDVPFLPHLVTGRFSTIDVAATDASGRVNAAQLQLTLHGVEVPREVLLGEPGRVTVERADGTIELTEAEVNRLLGDRLQGGELAIEEDGVEVRVQVPFLGQSLDALVTGELGPVTVRSPSRAEEVRLDGQGPLDSAQVNLDASRFTFQVPLPELPAGVRLERVETRPGRWCSAGRRRSGWPPDTLAR